jgi:uncharacterized protein involved in exopolysaccharide biosynthesis
MGRKRGGVAGVVLALVLAMARNMLNAALRRFQSTPAHRGIP